jgi:hypothetical protein
LSSHKFTIAATVPVPVEAKINACWSLPDGNPDASISGRRMAGVDGGGRPGAADPA